MLERSKEVPLLADNLCSYSGDLVILWSMKVLMNTSYKIHVPYGSNFPWKGTSLVLFEIFS